MPAWATEEPQQCSAAALCAERGVQEGPKGPRAVGGPAFFPDLSEQRVGARRGPGPRLGGPGSPQSRTRGSVGRAAPRLR